MRPWTVLSGGLAGGVALDRPADDALAPLALLPPPRTAGDLVERLLHLIDQGTFACSPQGQIIFANASLSRLLGHDAPAVLARRTSSWITPRDGQGTFWDRLSTAAIAAPVDVWLRRRDGSRVPALARGRAVRNEDGDLIGFEGIIAPIASPLARQVQRLKTRLVRRTTRTSADRAEERKTLSRRLHDDLGQTLVVLKLELERLIAQPSAGSAGLAGERRSLNALRTWADEALQTVRTLCFELRDAASGPLDVTALLEPLVRDLTRRWKLRARVVAPGARIRLEGRRAILVAEICREALTNVVRHAQATDVTVRIERRGRSFSLTVSDNGRGFSPDALERQDSFGVLGMRERAQALGGLIDISREHSTTVVSLSVPFGQPPAVQSPRSPRDQSPHRR